jgi:RNA-directed DNA polymerase
LSKTKSFCISKAIVWESYQRVKSNQGGCGIDQCSIEDFEKDLKNNLYKIWNRMSSGSYLPPMIRRVDIPKRDGGSRSLGIPTVGDRIAQMVVKRYLEPELEGIFHPDSYGYRPQRSAHDALAQTRKRCWQYNWVIDLDIKGFFDTIPHDLLLRAVQKHTQEPWVLLYIERWLKASVLLPDGTVEERNRGTPQGGVISPLLSNLFLHYTFDHWMGRNYPDIPFERYADDAVVHCRSEAEAQNLKQAIAERMEQCGLELHPEKTKIVYCKDGQRTGQYPVVSFDFLGYCFRARLSRNRYGQYFVNFSPAIAPKARRSIYAVIREWKRSRRSERSIRELAKRINPVILGWVNYYGAFYKSSLLFLVHHLDRLILKWVKRKYKKHGSNLKRAKRWITRVKSRYPELFVHWSLLRVS